jgi:hypothetical protein
MYDNFAAIREGFTKNSYAILATASLRAWRAGAASTLGGLPALLLAAALLRRAVFRPGGLAALALTASMAIAYARWLTAFGVPRPYALLHPLAAWAFQTISLGSVWRSLTRTGLTWKGRTYSGIDTGISKA